MGGLERLLVEFARHADRDRFEIRFVSLSTRGSLAREIEAFGWPVTALGEADGLRPRMVLRLAALFRRWDINVVHTHDDRALIYGSLASRLAGRRVLHTRHGQSVGITPRQLVLVNSCARLTHRFVCVSEDSARVSQGHGVPAHRLCAIRNGIDVTRFAYTGPRPNGPVVTVARLSPEKDVACLLRAVAIAVPRYPELRLEVAGDGVCLPALKELSRHLGLERCVSFLGQVRDIPSLLGRAGLFVLPSLTEGISLTLLEAMARGLPVVATQVGGTPEVVADGETGLLVPAANPLAMADAMVRLLRDAERSRDMGLRARGRVERFFDVRRMVADYEALYQEPVGRRARRWRRPGGARSRQLSCT
jgi:glycosyltransferase involved in cell wall biosynthesis